MDGVSVQDPLKRRGVDLDPGSGSLRVNGRKIDMDSRSLSVLSALAAQFGERVSKDRLLAAAWPNQVVHENSLAKAISRLRRVLDGSGLEIVASYGIGYSLRETPQAEAEAEASPPAPAAMPARPRSRWTAPVAIVLVAVAVVLAVAFQTRTPAVAIRDTAPITYDAPNSIARILWVDDNPSNNELDIAYLDQNRVAVHQAKTTDDALKLLRINEYRLVVSDLGRGDDRLAGLKLIAAMKREGLAIPVIIYTVRPEDAQRQQAQRQLVAEAGAVDLALTPEDVRKKVLDRVAS